MTLSESTRDLMHFRNLCSEFDCFIIPDQLEILCDNQSAIFVAANLVNNSRSKHIDIRYHFIREEIEAGLIKLKIVASESNWADIFTKPLSTEVFVRIRNIIMGY